MTIYVRTIVSPIVLSHRATLRLSNNNPYIPLALSNCLLDVLSWLNFCCEVLIQAGYQISDYYFLLNIAAQKLGFEGHLQCPFLGAEGTERRRRRHRGGCEWGGVSPSPAD